MLGTAAESAYRCIRRANPRCAANPRRSGLSQSIQQSLIALLVLLAAGAYWQRDAPLAGTGWTAKRLCSGIFVAGRHPATLIEAGLPLPIALPIEREIDFVRQRVTTRVLGSLAPSVAQFRARTGCTLVDDAASAQTLLEGPDVRVGSRSSVTLMRPLPERATPPALAATLAEAFEQSRDGEGSRAIVVMRDGAVIAERYAEGFDAGTPLAGWSMAKSVTSALIGLLVDAGRIDIDAPLGIRAWSDADDPRGAITWDQMLRMSSGLAFEEDYLLPSGDAIQMLFGRQRGAAGAYAASRPLAAEIDSRFEYASGTTNILQHALLTRVFDGDVAAYQAFPRNALFAPLGMTRAVLEPDASGSFVGSSFMFATARDWARFGQLYLDGGRFDGQRILSREWIDYSVRPTPTNPRGDYGAHWWLNTDPQEGTRRMPALPANAFRASGFEGQSLLVLPDERLVIVRLGLDRTRPFDIAAFGEKVIQATRVD